MNDVERMVDRELLIRIDERTAAIHEWIVGHKQVHKDERAQVKKYLYLVWATVAGILAKTFFFK